MVCVKEIAMQLVEKLLVAVGSVLNEFQLATTVDRHFPKSIPLTAKREKSTRICKVCRIKSKVETWKILRKETQT